jgi:hypothetical protein
MKSKKKVNSESTLGTQPSLSPPKICPRKRAPQPACTLRYTRITEPSVMPGGHLSHWVYQQLGGERSFRDFWVHLGRASPRAGVGRKKTFGFFDCKMAVRRARRRRRSERASTSARGACRAVHRAHPHLALTAHLSVSIWFSPPYLRACQRSSCSSSPTGSSCAGASASRSTPSSRGASSSSVGWPPRSARGPSTEPRPRDAPGQDAPEYCYSCVRHIHTDSKWRMTARAAAAARCTVGTVPSVPCYPWCFTSEGSCYGGVCAGVCGIAPRAIAGLASGELHPSCLRTTAGAAASRLRKARASTAR